MAVEQRQAFHGGHEVGLDPAISLDEDDVFHYAGGGFAIDIGQFEAVAMQVHGVRIVGAVIEDDTVAFALLQRARRVFVVEGLAVDGPLIEAALAAVDLADDERNGLVGHWYARGVAETRGITKGRVVPRLAPGGLDPAGLAALAGVLRHNAHTVLAVVIHRRAEDPHTGVLHLHYSGDAFRRAQFQ